MRMRGRFRDLREGQRELGLCLREEAEGGAELLEVGSAVGEGAHTTLVRGGHLVRVRVGVRFRVRARVRG